MQLARNAAAMAVGILVIVTSGCGDDKSASGGPSSSAAAGSLTGTSWTLTSYATARSSTPTSAAAPASLTFRSAGALSGTTGCNSFSGNYTADASKLTITLGPMTQAACADAAAQAQETAITQLLPTTASYALEATSLTLMDQKGATLLAYSAAASDLPGTSWSVTGVNNGKDAVEATALTEALTATFGQDGSFQAFGGCNQLSGKFTTSGNNGVKIGPLASTRKTCGDAVDQLETEYSAALGNVATWEINGQTLTLRDAQGATQVTATQAASSGG
jgi:heat shock protein HslJ